MKQIQSFLWFLRRTIFFFILALSSDTPKKFPWHRYKKDSRNQGKHPAVNNGNFAIRLAYGDGA
ncbi:hypothetical protein BIY37_04625 [Candidatus Brocadia sapporoensis]|uniref:Uncharacterized protein n=1 Tax=Candidatus Brocadia sapporoensis TaxID=392547 RepID=A0A1V6M1B1_9BACT|nr:hypothetical protein BIY37_04625 [Candidatus Brocadia sapporoensis]